jgi:L-ascorbate metabolism protein UlaG (beta-lactamase superfamily)
MPFRATARNERHAASVERREDVPSRAGVLMPDVTWWGHATCTIDDRGVRVLTDPLFCSRLGHLRRRRGPPPDDRSRRADLAVVSHLHADHLHIGSLALLPLHVPLVVPRGALRAVSELRRLRDREFVEVGPGDAVRVGELVVEAVPATHDDRRWPWSRRRAPALGYVVSGDGRTYFAGDTDRSDTVQQAVGRCDIALLPVGGWGPTLGPGHLDPVGAAALLAELDAYHAVPVHFGTMWPVGLGSVRPDRFHRPGADFARQAARLGLACSVRELWPGETARFDLPRRHPPRGPSGVSSV